MVNYALLFYCFFEGIVVDSIDSDSSDFDFNNFSQEDFVNHFKKFSQKQNEQELLDVLNAAIEGFQSLACCSKAVRALIQLGVNLDCKTIVGNTPLIVAAKNNQTELMRILIEAGPNLDAADEYKGCTALMWTIINDNFEGAQILIEAGASLWAVNSKHSSALSCAIKGICQFISELQVRQIFCILEKKLRKPNPVIVKAKFTIKTEMMNLLFSLMTEEQLQNEMKLHPDLPIQEYFDSFKKIVIEHRMNVFKTLGPLALDINEKNIFCALPRDLIGLIASFYSAIEINPDLTKKCMPAKETWKLYQAWRDAYKICDAIVKNGPLTFISPTFNSNKRKAEDALDAENPKKKVLNFN